MQHFTLFVKTIGRFNLIPKVLHSPIAVGFLGSELAVVVAMIFGEKLLLWGFLLAGLLLILFSIALVSILIRKIQTPCNCFGSRGEPVSLYDVIRNVIFILCTLGGWQVNLILDGHNNLISLNILELSLIALTALVFVLAVINLNEIIQVFK